MQNIDPPITTEMLRLIAELDEFKGRWKVMKMLSPEVLIQLRRIATIESVGSSTRIEGSRLSDTQVAALLANLKTESFQSRDEEEVAGYAEAMNLIFDSWDVIPLTENHVHQMHRVLLQYSAKDERHRGEYKKIANHVSAYGPDGKEIGVVFETTSPFDTPFEMRRLFAWLEQVQLDEELHSLIVIGIFVVRFLAIHPYQDGNGRLSRVLTTLLLLRAGYLHVPFTSLESVVEENKASYYVALRKTQLTLKSDGPDWEPWLGFFLRCLVRQKEKLKRKIESQEMRMPELSELGQKIIQLLESESRITVARVVAATRANRNTAKSALQKLEKAGLLSKAGKGRGAHYLLARAIP